MNSYGLEATHFMSSPGIAWQAMLKMTKVEMELFQCPLMHDFIEMGIRGGVSTISHRLPKSNIPDTKTYNPNEETKHLIYLDMNNLYGTSMIEKLPIKDFRFLTEEEIALQLVK